MNKDIADPEELPEVWGRLCVGGLPQDTGPIKIGGTVTVKLAADIDLYIKVESVERGTIKGVLVAIGPRPRIKYANWKIDDRIAVTDQAVRAVIRTD